LYKIAFYRDRDGKEPVYEYLKELSQKTDKDSRIKLNKIQDYIQVLSKYGTRAGKPYLKHLDGDIWELRPLRDRVLFAAWANDGFVLLHHFMKKTQKTPKREIDKAKRELADFTERGKKP
jgi:phage-related protein